MDLYGFEDTPAQKTPNYRKNLTQPDSYISIPLGMGSALAGGPSSKED